MKREEFIEKRRAEVLSRPAPKIKPKKQRSQNPESIGESVVRYFLEFNHIEFEKEKSFPDLHGEHGGLLRFDFFIPSLKTLIEYDGQQHYNVGPKYSKTKKELLSIKHHDMLKNKWASKNNYHLIRIPYYDLEKTHIILKNKLTYIHGRQQINSSSSGLSDEKAQRHRCYRF